MTTQFYFQRLSAATILNYKSFANGYKKAARDAGINVDIPNEALCQWICQFLNILGQTRRLQYIVSMRACIADYYKPKYGDFIGYDVNSQYFKGNPGKHFAIMDKTTSIKATKIRDHGEVAKKSYPLEYNDVINIQKGISGDNASFCISANSTANSLVLFWMYENTISIRSNFG